MIEHWTQTDTQVESTSSGLGRLWLFLFLSLVASWAIWLSPFWRQGTFSLNVLRWQIAIPFLLIKLLLGNCTPGAIALVFALLEGKQQFLETMSSLLRWAGSH